MAPIDPKIQTLAPKGVTFTKQLERTVNGQKTSIFIGKNNQTGEKVRYAEVDGQMQELVEKTTAGKNTYITKGEADKVIKQILGTESVPAGVTVKYETDQNGTTSPVLLFRGEKLNPKDMRELAETTKRNDEITKNMKDMAKNIKLADSISVPKTNIQLAQVDLKKLEVIKPTPQGANETDKTKKLKRAPKNLQGNKAKVNPQSEEVIKKVKAEKAEEQQIPEYLKKPEVQKPEFGYFNPVSPEEKAKIEEKKKAEATKAANWKKAVDGGKQFRENLKGREVSNPFYKVTLNSDTIRGFVQGAGGPSLVDKVWTSNMSFVQKKAVLIEILKNVKGHGMQNATVKGAGNKNVKMDELINNLKNAQGIISPEDRRLAYVFIQKLMAQ